MSDHVDKIGLYADDMILFLAEPGPSLALALDVITKFGKFSGLTINWDNSQILPLDVFPPTADQTLLPLVRVASVKHLGVQVSPLLD